LRSTLGLIIEGGGWIVLLALGEETLFIWL
jgi:hypothetical protein